MPIRFRYLVLVPLAVGAALLGAARPAAAAFNAGAGAALSITSATLAPPTGLAATTSCPNGNNGSSIKVTWKSTVSTYATGYMAYLSANGGTPQAVNVSISANATSATIPISNRVNYTATLRSTYGSWSSAASAPTGTVRCN